MANGNENYNEERNDTHVDKLQQKLS